MGQNFGVGGMGGVGPYEFDVGQKHGEVLNVLLFKIILYKKTSIEYDLIVPTEFNKRYSSSLSYLICFVLLLSK